MKHVIRVGLVLVSVVVLVILFGWIYLDYPLPIYEGDLTLEGLEKPVEVYFDDYGVPHLYAQNEHDLFFAAGYIAARERLFQMTITAAAVEGRLSELFGERALPDDIYLRIWGIPKMARILAESMHPDARAVSSYFSDGINAYIDAAGSTLPVEFKLLRIKPIRWEPAYVAGFARLMGHNLTFSWKPEIVLGQVAYMYGDEKLKELWPFYPPGEPAVASAGGHLYARLWEAMSEREESVRDILQMNGGHLGSNNWVISGAKTLTGKPILANDPHLPYSQPATWYEMHLVGGRFNVSGACLAGIPVPVLGQNESCAWGFTNLMVDDVDFYVETVNPENPNEYLYDGEWRPMVLREETISVKGGQEKTVTIRETVHGPIISDIHPLLKGEDKVVSMRWGGHDLSDEIYALLQLSLIKNWNDFTEAAKNFSVPGQNVVYADTAGNIGWRLFARIPIRKGGSSLVPVPGTSSQWDWKGYVPFEEMPYLLNPPSGIIITANNKVVGDSFPYYVSSFWEDPSRADRIGELLNERTNMTVEDMKATQLDVVSPFARKVARYFVEAFKRPSGEASSRDQPSGADYDKDVQTAVGLLVNWDGDHSPASPAAAVFNAALLRLLDNVYGDEMRLMGDGFYRGWLTLPSMSFKNLRHIMENGYSSWFDNINTKDVVEGEQEILIASLVEGVRDLEARLGPDPDGWRWGRLHTLTHPHKIGKASPLLDALFNFNVGPFERGGSGTTVNSGDFLLYDPFYQVVGPSFRRIVDFSQLDRTQFIIPTGESGLPKSPHYRDQAPLYNAGTYRTTHFNEETIRNSGFRRLVLSPAGQVPQ
ncbi:MAG: penicillin acylase family protein [Fidelibacterota bacterium]